jgi:hypothetical protein
MAEAKPILSLPLGSAKITHKGDFFQVDWRNHGSFLEPIPRLFLSKRKAVEWCEERGLKVIREKVS